MRNQKYILLSYCIVLIFLSFLLTPMQRDINAWNTSNTQIFRERSLVLKPIWKVGEHFDFHNNKNLLPTEVQDAIAVDIKYTVNITVLLIEIAVLSIVTGILYTSMKNYDKNKYL